jgi:hypothetical protein
MLATVNGGAPALTWLKSTVPTLRQQNADCIVEHSVAISNIP